jgi:predicted DNA-binding transcriptional regulator AlpA
LSWLGLIHFITGHGAFPTLGKKAMAWLLEEINQPIPEEAEAPVRLLNIHEVSKLVGVSVGSLRNWIRIGSFPQPHKFGAGPTSKFFWFRSQLRACPGNPNSPRRWSTRISRCGAIRTRGPHGNSGDVIPPWASKPVSYEIPQDAVLRWGIVEVVQMVIV